MFNVHLPISATIRKLCDNSFVDLPNICYILRLRKMIFSLEFVEQKKLWQVLVNLPEHHGPEHSTHLHHMEMCSGASQPSLFYQRCIQPPIFAVK